MTPDSYLLVFALAFLSCVLATPVVTRVAVWLGAIDRPDQYRRIHKGATPRMGGLGLAVGVAAGVLPLVLGGLLPPWPGLGEWSSTLGWVAGAAAIVLALGVVDDTVGVGPRAKLLGQAAAVMVLYAGGIRIESVEFLGVELPLSLPLRLALPGAGLGLTIDPPSMLLTLFWFLGCMNIWNLIDGMDGLASGVGLLVTGTMMLVAFSLNNYGSALMAASLAGGLAGFLLYNWHPACIFLGDSGSLLIGLLIGVIGVQGSLKGTMAVSILLPILAMGLPISDTALAIFRRWLRNLPLSAADRRHVHHLLIGLGLNPRQAAAMLYCFTAFLCGVVLLGVAAHSDVLALGLGISGCLAFVLILYSRRDELRELKGDLSDLFVRGRQERHAAKATWEAIQRVELCTEVERALEVFAETAEALGAALVVLDFHAADGRGARLEREATAEGDGMAEELSGSAAQFRLFSAGDARLTVDLHLTDHRRLASDIAFRFLHRLALATSERLGRLVADGLPTTAGDDHEPSPVLVAEGPAWDGPIDAGRHPSD